MIFKCKNCGGNVVYNPAKKAMHCPHCDGVDSEQKVTGERTLTHCVNCGAPLEVGEFHSAGKCQHCGTYVIYDERVEDKFKPDVMIPFSIDREKAKEILRETFKRKAFTPASFLSDATLEKMEGIYVPFWLYNYLSNVKFRGEGIRRRTWVSGDTEYTETSYYDVVREMEIDFSKIPVDASATMDDKIMDLLEPYEYKELSEFQDKFLSGFLGECYNEDADTLEGRALEKVERDSENILQTTIHGYDRIKQIHKSIDKNRKKSIYALLPVWHYSYLYKGKTYDYYVNGQFGKVIGTIPVSIERVLGYGLTVWAGSVAILAMLKQIMEVLG